MEAEEAQPLRRALTRLVIDWASAGTQADIAATAGVTIDVVDIPALYLLGIEGESRLAVLAAHLRQSAPTTSKQLLRLQRRGFVAKRTDPTDGRGTLFRLRTEGEEAVAALNAVTDRAVLAVLDEHGEHALPLAQRTTRLLEQLLENGRRATLSPPPRP